MPSSTSRRVLHDRSGGVQRHWPTLTVRPRPPSGPSRTLRSHGFPHAGAPKQRPHARHDLPRQGHPGPLHLAHEGRRALRQPGRDHARGLPRGLRRLGHGRGRRHLRGGAAGVRLQRRNEDQLPRAACRQAPTSPARPRSSRAGAVSPSSRPASWPGCPASRPSDWWPGRRPPTCSRTATDDRSRAVFACRRPSDQDCPPHGTTVRQRQPRAAPRRGRRIPAHGRLPQAGDDSSRSRAWAASSTWGSPARSSWPSASC